RTGPRGRQGRERLERLHAGEGARDRGVVVVEARGALKGGLREVATLATQGDIWAGHDQSFCSVLTATQDRRTRSGSISRPQTSEYPSPTLQSPARSGPSAPGPSVTSGGVHNLLVADSLPSGAS